MTCDDRDRVRTAGDEGGARTCAVAWVAAARGAHYEGTSARHRRDGRSGGHTAGAMCLARSCYSLPTHHTIDRTLRCKVCDKNVRSRAHRPKRPNAWRAARSGSWLRLHQWPHGAEIVTCGATAHKLMSAQLPVSEVGECSGHMCEGPRAHAPHGSVNLWLG